MKNENLLWICPICGETEKKNHKCVRCYYDERQDMVNLRSVGSLDKGDLIEFQNSLLGYEYRNGNLAQLHPQTANEHAEKVQECFENLQNTLVRNDWRVGVSLKRLIRDETVSSPLNAKQLSAENTIFFGHYEQNGGAADAEQEIEWEILEIKEDRVLLLSKFGLDAKEYHEKEEKVTWETSSLRSWLNQEFLMTAFDSEERAQIVQTTVIADNNPDWKTNAGSDTVDSVFLLSVDEAEAFFSGDVSRQCQPTEYARQRGWVDSDKGNSCWWLRTPGLSSFVAAGVDSTGKIQSNGYAVNYESIVVRPALWLNLNSDKAILNMGGYLEDLQELLVQGSRECREALEQLEALLGITK